MDFPSDQGFITWNYYLPSHDLIIDSCLVQRFNMPKTFPWAFFSNLYLLALMWLMNYVKLGVEPNPTCKLAIQSTTQWSKLGP